MKCPMCSSLLIFQNEWNYADFGIEENGIVSIYTCNDDSCNIDDVHIYTPIIDIND